MKTLVETLRKRAEQTPQLIAVSDRNENLTYQKLDELTDLFAVSLLRKGITSGTFVGVYVKRTRNILIGALSAMKAGGAYLPIDAEYPKDRIAYMIEDAACLCILTERSLWDGKPMDDFNGKVIFLDEAPSETYSEENRLLLSEAAGKIGYEDNAMLLYTSGTTGKPKGVVHTHASICAMSQTFPADKNPLGTESNVGVFAGFTFIASALCLFAPLFTGSTVSIIWENLRSDLDGLYRYLRKNGITHLFLAPSLGCLLAERYDMRGITMLLGGEKMRPVKGAEDLDILNVYGSTEGVIISGYRLKGDETEIPLGLPTKGTDILILNDDGKKAEPDETGELLYSSGFMAKEYFHLPELTKEKWLLIDGKRYFRMGDRVRCDASGMLWYVGRADDMVKIHGYRVELGEVENRIAFHGGVNFACAVRTVRGTDKLCCFYEEGNGFAPEQIKLVISKELASYMIPELWVPLESLPRNANGKIVRRQLPTPVVKQTDYVAPVNDVQAMIVKHMEELLGILQIGMNDSFVVMGGDSVRAMALSSRLRQRGIILPSSDILQAESVCQLCELAKVQYEKIWDEAEWEAIQEEFYSRGEKIQKVLPLTRKQEATLMNQLLYPDDPDQVRFYSFLIDCTPKESDVRSALDALSERFECLREAVIYKNVSTIQQVITDRKIPLTVRKADNYKQAQEISLLFRKENGPFQFDLQDTSQMRMLVVYLPNGGSLILAATQRFALDEIRLRWYFSVFFQELEGFCTESLEIPAWVDVLSMGITEEDKVLRNEEADGSYFASLLKNAVSSPEEAGKGPESPVFTYSDIKGAKKLVFVHTANTGSEAYYNLAKRIQDTYSFAVMEQYNLYHPGEEVYGLKELAKKYLEVLKTYQPEGPYCLGGWCYGGMIAYEMACQLEKAGEKVEMLIMLDSQIAVGQEMKQLSRENQKLVKRDYFETCPLFEDMRTRGMLERLIQNYQHVAHDVVEYTPDRYHGKVTFFKPEVIPEGSAGAALEYQKAILAKKAGGYEDFVDAENLKIVLTPYEHDLMMNDASLDVIVPALLNRISESRIVPSELEVAPSELGLNKCKTFSLPATMEGWDTLRTHLTDIPSINESKKLELCLIAEEVMVNIITYAYPEQKNSEKCENGVEVIIDIADNVCKMTFTDSGIPFDQTIDISETQDYDPLMQLGGAGRIMIANMADHTSYEYKNGKNMFSIEKNLI